MGVKKFLYVTCHAIFARGPRRVPGEGLEGSRSKKCGTTFRALGPYEPTGLSEGQWGSVSQSGQSLPGVEGRGALRGRALTLFTFL